MEFILFQGILNRKTPFKFLFGYKPEFFFTLEHLQLQILKKLKLSFITTIIKWLSQCHITWLLWNYSIFRWSFLFALNF